MKRLISILLAAALLLSLASCGRKSGEEPSEAQSSASSSMEEEKAPQEEAPEEPQRVAKPFGVGYYKGLGINPYTCTNAQNQSIMGLVYEPLFELDNSFEAKPCLAESISVKVRKKTVQQEVKKDKKKTAEGEEEAPQEEEPAEGEEETDKKKEKVETIEVTTYTTYVTLTVRKGVFFSDGAGLHADDVAYSLEQAAAKGSIYRTRLAGISNISTSGKQTVTFSLNTGKADVAAILTIPIVKNGTAEGKFPTGTGPYVPYLKKSAFKKLTANKKWWREGTEEVVLSETGENGEELISVTETVKRPVDVIRVHTYEDSDDLIFGFSSAQVTAFDVDFTGVDTPQLTGSFSVTDYPTTNLIYLGCNTKKGTLCSSQKVRTALYRSLDREILAERMLARHAEGSALPVSPRSPWYDEELAEKLVYDVETARKLCKKSEISGRLKLIVNNDSIFKTAMAKEIKKELSAAGFHVDVEQLSWKEYKTALKEGSYDLYLGEVKLDGTFDLSRLIVKGGSLNYSGYSNDDLTTALQTYLATKDKVKEVDGEKISTKAVAAKSYFTLLYQKAPIIPICFKNGSVLTMSENVTGPLSTQQNLFAQVWRWKVAEDVAEASR